MQITGDLENQRKASSLHHKPTRETSVEEVVLIWALKEGFGRVGLRGYGLLIRSVPGLSQQLGQEKMWGELGWGAMGKNKAIRPLFSLKRCIFWQFLEIMLKGIDGQNP